MASLPLESDFELAFFEFYCQITALGALGNGDGDFDGIELLAPFVRECGLFGGFASAFCGIVLLLLLWREGVVFFLRNHVRRCAGRDQML